MQFELRTQVIEPRRRAFSSLTERLGDRPASRYEEGSLDVQPTENFHYRPLWDPAHEIYDPGYSRLRLADPYAFTDPRQYYYAPYVTARAQLHEAMGATLGYLERRELLERLPEGWRGLLGDLVLPLRHYESGAQLVSAFGCRFGDGTTITQCLSYAAFDRVGNAQMIGRVGIQLGGGTDALLGDAKEYWTEATWMQPMRRYLEELLVERDWAVAYLGLDLADRLLYDLLYRYLDEVALLGGAGAYSLLGQHFAGWFTEHRRWVDSLGQAWAQDPTYGAANTEIIARTVADRLPMAAAAVTAIAARADELIDAGCVARVRLLTDRWASSPDAASRPGRGQTR